ncbi:Solute carrier family 22 member 6 [Chionoecetes opilio]|nr:Solute carrier family 22 member 6 [Chionoecetes opilio]
MVGKMAITASFQMIIFFSGELFPTEVRSRGVSTAVMLSRLGSMGAPFITDLVGSMYPWAPFVIFGSCALLAGAGTFLLPETRGQVLPDTVAHLEARERCRRGSWLWRDGEAVGEDSVTALKESGKMADPAAAAINPPHAGDFMKLLGEQFQDQNPSCWLPRRGRLWGSRRWHSRRLWRSGGLELTEVELPEVELPGGGTPEVELPEVGLPEVGLPGVGPRRWDSRRGETPGGGTPEVGTPGGDSRRWDSPVGVWCCRGEVPTTPVGGVQFYEGPCSLLLANTTRVLRLYLWGLAGGGSKQGWVAPVLSSHVAQRMGGTDVVRALGGVEDSRIDTAKGGWTGGFPAHKDYRDSGPPHYLPWKRRSPLLLEGDESGPGLGTAGPSSSVAATVGWGHGSKGGAL